MGTKCTCVSAPREVRLQLTNTNTIYSPFTKDHISYKANPVTSISSGEDPKNRAPMTTMTIFQKWLDINPSVWYNVNNPQFAPLISRWFQQDIIEGHVFFKLGIEIDPLRPNTRIMSNS